MSSRSPRSRRTPRPGSTPAVEAPAAEAASPKAPAAPVAPAAESGAPATPAGRGYVSSPYRYTSQRPDHLANWQLPREWAWGTDGVWIGVHRHTQQVTDPLGRTLSLVTVPDPAHWPWLTAEARALGNRLHRAIATTYVYWPRNSEAPCGPGYVRQWIDGVPLAMQLRTQGPDPIDRAVTRLRNIGSCLAMLHERGETHGAVNAEAAWMTRAGEHYLLGWQWALPAAALPPGKVPSLEWTVVAPEWEPAVAAGDPWWRPTAGTDQYQLGALIVASMTGLPWEREMQEAWAALEVRSDLPQSVRDLLRRATASDPAERFPSVAALLQALDRAVGGESSLAGLAVGVAADGGDAGSAAARQEARLRAVTGLDYELLQQLGRGGSGAVWRARDLSLGREVALKALNPDIAQDPAAVARLRREARVLASLAHPRIIPVLDFDERQGVAYFTMPLTPGGSLAALVTARGALPLSDVGPEVDALLDAVATAHAAGVVHRDLKPENILLDRAGRWMLADFGIAAPPGVSGAAGTLAFAAPEQLRGAPQGEAVDRYAMAAVAYFALTGHLPFVAHDPEMQRWRQEQGLEWRASWAARVAPPLREWLARGLAFNAADRFASTSDMRDAWMAACRAASDGTTGDGVDGADDGLAADARRGLRTLIRKSRKLLPEL